MNKILVLDTETTVLIPKMNFTKNINELLHIVKKIEKEILNENFKRFSMQLSSSFFLCYNLQLNSFKNEISHFRQFNSLKIKHIIQTEQWRSFITHVNVFCLCSVS
jgi:hypothetical protein